MSRTYKINIVGCGGTGGYVVPNVLRLLKEKGHNALVELYDHDYVEERNIPRQNFCYEDVGKNKAQVLAERYASAFGVPITIFNGKLTDKNFKRSTQPAIWVMCVDNNETRRLVADSGERMLDVGNELKYGQVFYHLRKGGSTDIYAIHPEIKENKKGSCGDAPEQSFLINYMAANGVTIFLNHLIETEFKPKYYEMSFDILGQYHIYRMTEYGKYAELARKVQEAKTGKKGKKKVEIEHKPVTKENVEIGLVVYGECIRDSSRGSGVTKYKGLVEKIIDNKQTLHLRVTELDGNKHNDVWGLYQMDDGYYHYLGDRRSNRPYPMFINMAEMKKIYKERKKWEGKVPPYVEISKYVFRNFSSYMPVSSVMGDYKQSDGISHIPISELRESFTKVPNRDIVRIEWWRWVKLLRRYARTDVDVLLKNKFGKKFKIIEPRIMEEGTESADTVEF